MQGMKYEERSQSWWLYVDTSTDADSPAWACLGSITHFESRGLHFIECPKCPNSEVFSMQGFITRDQAALSLVDHIRVAHDGEVGEVKS